MAADYSFLSNLLEELSAAVYTQEPRPAPPFEGPDSFLSIIGYLDAHYDQTVSLKRVSEELHLNASYISQLIPYLFLRRANRHGKNLLLQRFRQREPSG